MGPSSTSTSNSSLAARAAGGAATEERTGAGAATDTNAVAGAAADDNAAAGAAASAAASGATEPPSATSPAQAGPAPLTYTFASSIPDYWLPLLPVQLPAAAPGAPRPRAAALKLIPLSAPRGRVLNPEGRTGLTLNEEEVTRAGALVTRSWAYARWTDGSTHLWVGRRKRPSRSEGSSGLRFDQVTPKK